LNLSAITIEGVVTSVGRSGRIFHLEPSSKDYGHSLKVYLKTSDCYLPEAGEVCVSTGKIEVNKKWGKQLTSSEVIAKFPSGKFIIDFLALNERFTGVSYKTSKALWKAFGDKLFDVLNDGDEELILDKARLANNRKIDEYVVENLVEAWKEYKDVMPTLKFFTKIQLTQKVARKAMEMWPENTIEKVKENPYRLIALSSWKKIDGIALCKIGLKEESKERLIAAVEWSLYEAFNDQDTAMMEQALESRTEELLGLDDIGKTAIGLALSDSCVVKTKQKSGEVSYQTSDVMVMEKYIMNAIRDLCDDAGLQKSLFEMEYTNERMSEFEALYGLKLTDEQKNAIKMVTEKPFAVITGGAGVGKTTVLKGIFHMLPEHSVIIQAAQTNRAATRMQESTGLEAITIARLLTKKLPENMYLFIDEASMIDAPTFYKILSRIPQGTRLYLLGDHHQLPPIGPGLILHLFVRDEFANVAKLTKVQRQTEETGIPKVCESIRRMIVPTLDVYSDEQWKSEGVSMVYVKNKNELLDEVLGCYRIQQENGDIQVLAARNDTCDAINYELHNENILNKEYEGKSLKVLKANEVEISTGDKIIFKNYNDRERMLFNGSMGVMIEIYDPPIIDIDVDGKNKEIVALAEFDTCGEIQLTDSDLEYIDLGYAVTVHKAQGSQWKQVVIVSEYLSEENRIVDNTWFYTAITRCQSKAIVVGSEKTFKTQISKPPRSFNRTVGLKFDELRY